MTVTSGSVDAIPSNSTKPSNPWTKWLYTKGNTIGETAGAHLANVGGENPLNNKNLPGGLFTHPDLV